MIVKPPRLLLCKVFKYCGGDRAPAYTDACFRDYNGGDVDAVHVGRAGDCVEVKGSR